MIAEALHKVDVLFDLASERTISTIDPQKIFSPLHVQAHGSIEPKSGAGSGLLIVSLSMRLLYATEAI